jgi:hypothetical protein
MNKKFLLVPADGVRLVRIDESLLADGKAAGKVEFLEIDDQLRSGVDAPAQRRSIRYPEASAVLDTRQQLPTAADFRTALDTMLANAESRGLASLVVRAGNLHNEVGGYPSTHHRMPVCCSVMRERMQPGDQVKDQPPKGAGASLEIEYQLPRSTVARTNRLLGASPAPSGREKEAT